jgi:hypothetical protein
LRSSHRVLLRRCAWHRHYRGYEFVYGIAEWRGLCIGVAAGICKGCARRLRGELGIAPPGWRASNRAPAADPLPVPPLAVTLIALAAVLFAAHPLDHPPRIVAPDAGSVLPDRAPEPVARPARRTEAVAALPSAPRRPRLLAVRPLAMEVQPVPVPRRPARGAAIEPLVPRAIVALADDRGAQTLRSVQTP